MIKGSTLGTHPRGTPEWFAEYFIPEPNSGCFLWVGGGNEHYGYARYRGRQMTAHRVAWEIAYGSIPPGLMALHKCDNGFCVNHRHLFLGTQLDNVRDMIAKGRDKSMSTKHRLKTQCPRGHDYDMVGYRGMRGCRRCRNDYVRRLRMRKHDQAGG